MFDKEKMKDYLENIAIPRAIGTQGNRIAVQRSQRIFEKVGLKVNLQEFLCNHFYSIWFLRIFLGSLISLIILTKYQLSGKNWYFFLAAYSILFALFIFVQNNHDKAIWGKKIRAKNVIAIPNRPENSRSHEMVADNNINIVISAHIDSKSQTFTQKQRAIWIGIVIVIFSVAIPLSLVFIVITIFREIPLINDVLFWVLIGDLFLFFLFFLLNQSGNKSPGALDNGTGMVVIFSIAEYIQRKIDKEPDFGKNLNFWFCLFNCEEFGQIGTINWIKSNQEILDPRNTWVFNFDMPGSRRDEGVTVYKTEGLLKKEICPPCQDLITKTAQEKNIPLQYTQIIVGKTDRIPFAKKGFRAVDFGSDKAIQWGHSEGDKIKNANFEILEKNCKLLFHIIESLNEG